MLYIHVIHTCSRTRVTRTYRTTRWSAINWSHLCTLKVFVLLGSLYILGWPQSEIPLYYYFCFYVK